MGFCKMHISDTKKPTSELLDNEVNRHSSSHYCNAMFEYFSTDEFGAVIREKPASIRSSLSKNGHVHNIRPLKLQGSGRLLWPRHLVAQLLIDSMAGGGNDGK